MTTIERTIQDDETRVKILADLYRNSKVPEARERYENTFLSLMREVPYNVNVKARMTECFNRLKVKGR
jgi:hypothetical protein